MCFSSDIFFPFYFVFCIFFSVFNYSALFFFVPLHGSNAGSSSSSLSVYVFLGRSTYACGNYFAVIVLL